MPKFDYRDGRFFIDGEPMYFRGAEYMYYRDKRSNWADRLDQLKAAHVNVIAFYTPWRHHILHDPETGMISYDFDGDTLDSRDLRHFIKLVTERGLYMLAKPGPFVHSELNIGGLPDVTSPTFNPGIEPVRIHNGQALTWEYDNTQLPSPADAEFDEMARGWLSAVREVLAPNAAPDGNIIAIQLLDETIYCTSNDAPWHFGYDAPDIRLYRQMLLEKYETIASFNLAHGTEHKSFDLVRPPVLEPTKPIAQTHGDLLDKVDWGEFQWTIRRTFYEHYKEILNIDLPHLTNFAGITPPIDENVPDAAEEAAKGTPAEYIKLYPEWWFAHNRVDQDLDIYEYGMISWLGVASYNIPDASSPAPDDIGRNEVFNRYINTARRRRGINIEENWGFSKLYHPMSKYPMIPFFQTLASVAGGCTGYVVFTGVSHGYWLDDLDRTTQKQYRTFPADAPIGENGETGAMYSAMSMLNEWFEREGSGFLKAELDMDVCFLVVPEYAAISSWVPDRKNWTLPHAIPRAGYDVIEPATMFCNENGINYSIAELPALGVNELLEKKRIAIHFGFFLGELEQEKLIAFVRKGGTLICSGELPEYDDDMQPCDSLAEFIEDVEDGDEVVKGKILYSTGNIFNDERAFLGNMKRAGWTPQVSYDDGLRAFVYRNKKDKYLFFFHFGRHGQVDKNIEFFGNRLELTVGSKTCGVVHVKGDRIRSYMVKGVNEFEGETATVKIKLGKQEYVVEGDGSAYEL